MKLAEVNAPARPVWVSETGYWSALQMYWGGAGVGNALMATYSPRALFEFWLAGAGRTYIYELADFDSADYFGLIDLNGNPKPAFYAVSNILTLLRDPGPPFTAGSLSYSLSGSTSQVQQVLFEKRDGSYYLALWVETPSLNANTLSSITVPQQAIQVNFGQLPKALTGYAWDATGTMTTATLPVSQTVALSIGPNITVLKIQ